MITFPILDNGEKGIAIADPQAERSSDNVDLATIATRWQEYSALSDIAPKGQRPGLAMARTRLLEGVPSWLLPAVLDALNIPRQSAPAEQVQQPRRIGEVMRNMGFDSNGR